jgi:hypothetical protein
VDVLSFPFRLTPDGTVAKVEQFSDADVAQKIAFLMQTEPGELPLALHYGISDPSFRTVNATEIEAAISAFYPGVVVNEIRIGVDGSGEAAVNVYFSNYTGD